MGKNGKILRALFNQASELVDEQARYAFVQEACAGDIVLQAKLEELLRSSDSAGGFLADSNPDDRLAAPVQEQEGGWIGHYKLLQKIGEGVVWSSVLPSMGIQGKCTRWRSRQTIAV